MYDFIIIEYYPDKIEVNLLNEINYFDTINLNNDIYISSFNGIYLYNIENRFYEKIFSYNNLIEKFKILKNESILFISDGELILYDKLNNINVNLIKEHDYVFKIIDFIISSNEDLIAFISETINIDSPYSELPSYKIFIYSLKWRFLKKSIDVYYTSIPKLMFFISNNIIIYDKDKNIIDVINIDSKNTNFNVSLLDDIKLIQKIESISMNKTNMLCYSVYDNNIKEIYIKFNNINKLLIKFKGNKGDVDSLKISPNNEWILYNNVSTEKTYIYLINIIKNYIVHINELLDSDTHIAWNNSGQYIIYFKNSTLSILRTPVSE